MGETFEERLEANRMAYEKAKEENKKLDEEVRRRVDEILILE